MSQNLSTANQPDKVKSGFYSSEFWLTLLTNLIGGAIQFDIFPHEHWSLKVAGMAGMVLATMGYSVSRARVKAGRIVSPKKAKALPAADSES